MEQHLSLKETAELLGISDATLRTMAKCEEIPHCRVGRNIFFRWTELDDWLDMQFNKRLPGKERRRAVRGTRSGIEPLLSERDIKEIFGGSVPTRSADGRFVPVYYIRSRKKYRLSDILAYIEEAQTDIYSLPRFSRGWRSGAFDRIPSEEEVDAERLARKFSRGKGDELVPGYEWASTQFSAASASEVEQRLVDFRDALEKKWEMARTKVDWDGQSFSVEVRYMRIPPAWAGFKVKRVTKRSEYQNLTKIRVYEFLAKNVPQDKLIETRYFTDSFYWLLKDKHCAIISYYVPVEGKPRDPGAILNPRAQEQYEKLSMESIIKIPHLIWQAINELQAGDLQPSKFARMLREADLFQCMDDAGLLVYERRDQILDVKRSNKPDLDSSWPYRRRYSLRSNEYARIIRMTKEENAAFERGQAEKEAASEP
jgi:excisionase family DNA binding protein